MIFVKRENETVALINQNDCIKIICKLKHEIPQCISKTKAILYGIFMITLVLAISIGIIIMVPELALDTFCFMLFLLINVGLIIGIVNITSSLITLKDNLKKELDMYTDLYMDNVKNKGWKVEDIENYEKKYYRFRKDIL